jgi:Rrf2 family protein
VDSGARRCNNDGVISLVTSIRTGGVVSANNRLTMAVHTLVWIVMRAQESDELATSEQVAGSVNTNPVVIRRILSQLKAAGLVESRRGVGAGWYLIKEPAEITLQDVYEAVEPGNLFALHATEPNQECPVGRGIQPALTTLYDRADQALREELATTTVADVLDDVVTRQRRRRRATTR